MLQLTRLGGPVFALNPDLIERAEATPDTVVTLVNGSRYVIRESLDELAELINEYRASIIAAAQSLTDRTRMSPRETVLRDVTPRDHNSSSTRASVVMLHPGER